MLKSFVAWWPSLWNQFIWEGVSHCWCIEYLWAMAHFNVSWKAWSTKLPVRMAVVWFPLNPLCYCLEEQITWRISHSSGFQQTVIWEIFPWFPEWGWRPDSGILSDFWAWPPRATMWFFNLRLDTLSLFISMALLSLIRHLKGLRMKLFMVSQTLFNHHKYVSKTLPAPIVYFYLLFD